MFRPALKRLIAALAIIVVAHSAAMSQTPTPPDNVIDISCSTVRDSVSFGIATAFSATGVHPMATPMVADIDGDSIPEIIVPKGNNTHPWLTSGLLVFDGVTGSIKRTISTQEFLLHGQCIAIADIDSDRHAEIFILSREGFISCLNHDGTLRWANATNVVPYNSLLTVADIMGNGTLQLVCGLCIFNADDGTLLLQRAPAPSGTGIGAPLGISPYTQPYRLYALADIDGDTTLELCAGNTIYKFFITNNYGTAGNSSSILRQADSIADIDNYDGQTFVADFDNDGDLDICVIGTSSATGSGAALGASPQTVNPYVWDGQTSSVIAHTSISNAAAQHRNFRPSIPIAVDIDSNGTPEILFSWNEIGLIRLAYDTLAAGNMAELPRLTTLSGTTGLSAFDFAGNRRTGLVHQNSTGLVVIDALTLSTLAAPLPLAASADSSVCYPVIADADADGHAEIILCHRQQSTGYNGVLTVLKGNAGNLWSPARKVWNQWAYNPVGVNEDLTIPHRLFDISTAFANGSRPFNTFLLQPTYITPEGNTFKRLADAAAHEAWITSAGDSLTVSILYGNQGDAVLDTHNIAIYRNSVSATTLLAHTIAPGITPDSNAVFRFNVHRSLLKPIPHTDSLIVAINGSLAPPSAIRQQECDTTNNTAVIATLPIIANDDSVTAYAGIALNINPIANDSNACPNPSYVIVAQPAHGSATVDTLSGTGTPGVNPALTITYTSTTLADSTDEWFLGTDSLRVAIHCNDTVFDTSWVFVHVVPQPEYITACDSLVWHGNAYLSDGTYHHGDNELRLTVIHSSSGDTTATACDSFAWYGTEHTASAEPTHAFTNAAGCDSTVTLHLTILHSSSVDTSVAACDSIVWRGSPYSQSGTYVNHQTSAAGCDSTTTLHLTVNHAVAVDTTAAACDSLYWHGTSLAASGDYSLVLQSAAGCDSTVTLHLTVNSSAAVDTTAVACDSLVWQGVSYSQSGTFVNYQTSAAGCDSTVTLHLTILHSSSVDTSVAACDSIVWQGSPYSQSGTYVNHQTSAAGCDSTTTLHLTVNHDVAVDTTAAACDSLYWHGTSLAASGDYSLVLQSAAGCDSTVTLHLTVNSSAAVDTTAVACDSLVWQGVSYSQSGTYVTHLVSAAGCDSVVTLTLTVNTSAVTAVADSFCAGTQYLFHDTVLTAAGDYSATLVAANGCDSTVELHLAMLAIPDIELLHDADCPRQLHYINLTTNAPYIHWDADIPWSPDWGTQDGHSLAVGVSQTVTLSLVADYNDYPTCPNTATVTLTPIVQPTAAFSVTPEVVTDNTDELFLLSRSSAAEWLQWFINDAEYGGAMSLSYPVDNSTDSVGIVLVAHNGECADTSSRTVTVHRSAIFAPNAFTPSESSNNTFRIFTKGIVESELSIYSRRGMLIFSTTDDTPWDGTFDGNPCPQASYLWILRYRSEADPKNWHTAKGLVTLLR